MERLISIVLALLALTSGLCGAETTTVAPAKLWIRMESFKPREIQAGADKQSEVRFYLSMPAQVRLVVADWDGEIVAERKQDCTTGEQKIIWDNALDTRDPSDGCYVFRIEASGADGQKALYDPGFGDALAQLKLPQLSLDAKTGEVSYELPQLAMVRVRLMHLPSLLVRTLMDWTPQLAGKHSIKWDGTDQSGNPVSLNDPELACAITAYSLPENAFIVTGTKKMKPARPLKAQREWKKNPALHAKYYHAAVPREQSHDPTISFEFLKPDGSVDDTTPVVIGDNLKIRMSVAESDVAYINDERFEVCVFIDGVFFSEDEEGTTPYTFDLKTAGINPGEHLLSVMLLTTADHIGVASKLFRLQSTAKKAETKKGER